MTVVLEGQHWKWNHCPWMPPLLYHNGSWRSTLEVKSRSLNVSPTIWQRLMTVNIGSEITVLECLPYNMIVAHEGKYWKWIHWTWMPPLLYDRDSWIQYWKWNLCTWMPPLLYDTDSWRSSLEVKSLYLNAFPTIRQRLMKVNTGSEFTVLECLPNYMIVAHEGQHWKWNHCPWMPPLIYDSGSWRSTLVVKSFSLNASPTIWQRLMKVNSGSKITELECHPYNMTVAHEGQHWKWNHCPWIPPLIYDSGSWRSTLEVKSLSLNASPTIWQRLMKVNTESEISVLECHPYYMTETHEGQHWKWNLCTWNPPLLYDRDSWRSKLEVKSLYLNASPTIW